MKVWIIIETMFAAIGGAIAAFLGGFDGLLTALVIFIVIDYITGIFAAVVQKRLSSAIGYKGIIRKALIFLIIGMADLIDRHILNLSVGGGEIVRDIVICFFLANEGVSIFENAALIGLPIPKVMKNILLQLREKIDKNKTDEETEETEESKGDE